MHKTKVKPKHAPRPASVEVRLAAALHRIGDIEAWADAVSRIVQTLQREHARERGHLYATIYLLAEGLPVTHQAIRERFEAVKDASDVRIMTGELTPEQVAADVEEAKAAALAAVVGIGGAAKAVEDDTQGV